jgi:hypothetical protein
MAAALAGTMIGSCAAAIGQVQIGVDSTVTKQIFMKVGRGYFLGALPRPGQVVEMVYTGKDADGELILMLRVRQ